MHRKSTSFFLKAKMYAYPLAYFEALFIIIDVGKGNTYSYYHFPRSIFFQDTLTALPSRTLNDCKGFLFFFKSPT